LGETAHRDADPDLVRMSDSRGRYRRVTEDGDADGRVRRVAELAGRVELGQTRGRTKDGVGDFGTDQGKPEESRLPDKAIGHGSAGSGALDPGLEAEAPPGVGEIDDGSHSAGEAIRIVGGELEDLVADGEIESANGLPLRMDR